MDPSAPSCICDRTGAEVSLSLTFGRPVVVADVSFLPSVDVILELLVQGLGGQCGPRAVGRVCVISVELLVQLSIQLLLHVWVE